MCLIIHKKQDQILETEMVKSAWAKNHDGWGVLYHRDNRLQIHKGMTVTGLIELLPALANKEAMIHFRMATHGAKDITMAHPFHIKDDFWMMHNGVFSKKAYQDPRRIKSDTALFAELMKDVVSMVPADLKGFVRSQKFTDLIKDEVQGQNIIFADDQGFIVTEGSLDYSTTCGLAVSNQYGYSHNNPQKKSFLTAKENRELMDFISGRDNDNGYVDDGSYAEWEITSFINNMHIMDYEDLLDKAIEQPEFIAEVLLRISEDKEVKAFTRVA